MIRRISLLLMFYNIVLLCDITEACSRQASKIGGIIVPFFTPYKEGTTELDITKVAPMGKYYADRGVSGLLVTSKAGEGNLFNEAECKALYKECVRVGRLYGLKILILVGPPTPLGISLAKYCDSIGVDVVLTLPSLFYPPRDAQSTVDNIKLIADSAKNTPVMLYVDPMTQPQCVKLYQVHKLAAEQICNYGGFRGGIQAALQIRAAGLFQPKCQTILISDHVSIQAAFALDFNVSVAVANSLVPERSVAIQNAKNKEQAAKLQQQINQIIVAVAQDPSNYIAYVKAAFSLISGIAIGDVRPPLKSLTCENKLYLTRRLQDQYLYHELASKT